MRFLSHRYVECASWPVKNTSPSWCVKLDNSDSLKYLGLALPSVRPAPETASCATELRFIVRRISGPRHGTPGGSGERSTSLKNHHALAPVLIVMS